MIRKHWHDRRFWTWFWRERVRIEVKAVLGAALIAGMLGGGWFAADRLSTASAGVQQLQAFTFETTVQKVVTVRQKGRVVRKLVPVVKKVFVKRSTAFKTTTEARTVVVTKSGGVRFRTVRTKFIVRVPVVSKKVVTVNGQTKTVVTTKLVPTTNIETQTNTLTRTQTQTQVQVQTQNQTVTNTVTATKTATVTQPVTTTRTVTTTQTVPVTVSVPVTVPVTVTIGVTITVP